MKREYHQTQMLMYSMQYIKHKEEHFIRYPNTKKSVLPNFELFGYPMKHSFKIIIASQSINNSLRKSKQKVPEFSDN